MQTYPTIASDSATPAGPLCFGPDRRRHTRLVFDCPVRWCVREARTAGAGVKGAGSRVGQDRIGWARDASETGVGLMVRTDAMPAIGDRIQVVFQLDNYCDWPIGHDAVVQWCESVGSGLCNLGIELLPPRMDSQPTAGDLKLRSLVRGFVVGSAAIPTA